MSWEEIYTSKEMSELYDDKGRSSRLQGLSSIQGVSATPGTSRNIRTDSILPQHIGIVRHSKQCADKRKSRNSEITEKDG